MQSLRANKAVSPSQIDLKNSKSLGENSSDSQKKAAVTEQGQADNIKEQVPIITRVYYKADGSLRRVSSQRVILEAHYPQVMERDEDHLRVGKAGIVAVVLRKKTKSCGDVESTSSVSSATSTSRTSPSEEVLARIQTARGEASTLNNDPYNINSMAGDSTPRDILTRVQTDGSEARNTLNNFLFNVSTIVGDASFITFPTVTGASASGDVLAKMQATKNETRGTLNNVPYDIISKDGAHSMGEVEGRVQRAETEIGSSEGSVSNVTGLASSGDVLARLQPAHLPGSAPYTLIVVSGTNETGDVARMHKAENGAGNGPLNVPKSRVAGSSTSAEVQAGKVGARKRKAESGGARKRKSVPNTTSSTPRASGRGEVEARMRKPESGAGKRERSVPYKLSSNTWASTSGRVEASMQKSESGAGKRASSVHNTSSNLPGTFIPGDLKSRLRKAEGGTGKSTRSRAYTLSSTPRPTTGKVSAIMQKAENKVGNSSSLSTQGDAKAQGERQLTIKSLRQKNSRKESIIKEEKIKQKPMELFPVTVRKKTGAVKASTQSPSGKSESIASIASRTIPGSTLSSKTISQDDYKTNDQDGTRK
ncbi:predicted protein [Nematostella vectensis]|uniref:Uncharacterized protein n=1 Tax=Nematostella vectensis TaxID=45351 RepID=A7RRX0_NEMVE|nr:predicted protein [Nematostella vectensis]|eukprot:XP_001637962.1 predicted protein [Nematostella vectensis]